MLPHVLSPNFRQALKEAREAAGLSYSELARKAGIHAVMPARYEREDHSNATLPSTATLRKLNAALFPGEGVESKGPSNASNAVALEEADTAAIVAELKRRGATSVTITW